MSLDENRARIQALLSEISQIDAELEQPDPGDLDKQAKEIEQQIQELAKQKRYIESLQSDRRIAKSNKRQDKANKKREIDNLAMSIRIEEENQRKAQDLRERFDQYDEMTKDCKWNKGVTLPDGREVRIMEHQSYGSSFLASAGKAILADSMGLGKTIQTIAALDKAGAKRVIIITPAEVMSNFYKEVVLWSDRPSMVIGKRPKAESFFMLDVMNKQLVSGAIDGFVIIVNYESWRRNTKLIQSLINLRPDTVILDEAHRIKKISGNAHQGVHDLIFAQNVCVTCNKAIDTATGFCVGCNYRTWDTRKSVERVFLLTGTPILNRPSELYPLLSLIDPETFWSEKGFLRQFCYEAAPGKWVFYEGGLSKLASKIQGFYLRRTLEDAGIHLPPQDVNVHEIDLVPEDYPRQAELIEMLSEYNQIMIDDEVVTPGMGQLALITRMRQAAVWPGGMKIKVPLLDQNDQVCYDMDGKVIWREKMVGDYFRESCKMDRAMELVTDYVEEGARVVIFSQFAEVIKELLARCHTANIRAVGYFGETTDSVKSQVKTNFDRNSGEVPKWEVVIAHYKSGGQGLNFTAATRTIITDEEWNPGMEDQALARTHRIGQTEETTVDILRMSAYIDTWMAKLKDDKRNEIAGFDKENDTYRELNEMLIRKPKKEED